MGRKKFTQRTQGGHCWTAQGPRISAPKKKTGVVGGRILNAHMLFRFFRIVLKDLGFCAFQGPAWIPSYSSLYCWFCDRRSAADGSLSLWHFRRQPGAFIIAHRYPEVQKNIIRGINLECPILETLETKSHSNSWNTSKIHTIFKACCLYLCSLHLFPDTLAHAHAWIATRHLDQRWKA